MKIIKEGSLEEYQRKEKEEATRKAMPWSRECGCSKCGAKFVVDINDLVVASSSETDHGYLCFCPTCEDLVDIGYVDYRINDNNGKLVETRSVILKNQKRYKSQFKKLSKKKR